MCSSESRKKPRENANQGLAQTSRLIKPTCGLSRPPYHTTTNITLCAFASAHLHFFLLPGLSCRKDISGATVRYLTVSAHVKYPSSPLALATLWGAIHGAIEALRYTPLYVNLWWHIDHGLGSTEVDVRIDNIPSLFTVPYGGEYLESSGGAY